MYRYLLTALLLLAVKPVFCWGFFAHRRINEYAVYLLPPEMLVFFKPRLAYLRDHATDPDKRRYIVKAEAPRHYIDLDHYGLYPFTGLPRRWDSAVAHFGEDGLQAHGILPWRIQQVYRILVWSFREKDANAIVKTATDLGHYIGDAHVPLHTSSNHNGQKTGQHGIHGFWESRLPELLADTRWDLLNNKARYISRFDQEVWRVVLESAKAVDSVLLLEKKLTAKMPADSKYAFEWRNNQVVKQYATRFSLRYNQLLRGMVERRMRQAIQLVADAWYSAWIDAGQPDLQVLGNALPPDDAAALDSLVALRKRQPVAVKTCD